MRGRGERGERGGGDGPGADEGGRIGDVRGGSEPKAERRSPERRRAGAIGESNGGQRCERRGYDEQSEALGAVGFGDAERTGTGHEPAPRSAAATSSAASPA